MGKTTNMSSKNELPIAIIGAGPVGLATAAHLVKRNLPFILLEAGDQVCSNLLSWSHIRVFLHGDITSIKLRWNCWKLLAGTNPMMKICQQEANWLQNTFFLWPNYPGSNRFFT